ncbi:unnamed protein product [Paramecium octaurelia]|uniref:Uncharacterized protein n=1 Tax=Paramecium octaurelia TaxID=43137 RepID=A0A8S1VRJ3_PAROT|nr:unnamed protein product [Paramecium octaurelia]
MISQIFFIYWSIYVNINYKFISGFRQVTSFLKTINNRILIAGFEINFSLSFKSDSISTEISKCNKYSSIRQTKICIIQLEIMRFY